MILALAAPARNTKIVTEETSRIKINIRLVSVK